MCTRVLACIAPHAHSTPLQAAVGKSFPGEILYDNSSINSNIHSKQMIYPLYVDRRISRSHAHTSACLRCSTRNLDPPGSRGRHFFRVRFCMIQLLHGKISQRQIRHRISTYQHSLEVDHLQDVNLGTSPCVKTQVLPPHARTSTPWNPRSTKSPLKTYLFVLDGIPLWFIRWTRSASCPWMSPT